MPAGIRFPTVGIPGSAEELRAELSQLIVDFSTPGMTVTPIRLLTGEHVFNEVIMEDVEVPDGMVLGNIGDGWRQVTSELAFERSGPERFLSTFPLFVELVRALGRDPGERAKVEVGGLGARLWTLLRMSLSVAGALEAGDAPEVEAALAVAAAELGDATFEVAAAKVRTGEAAGKAAAIAHHASTRTTQLYDRRQDEVSLDEVERILI